MNHRCWDNTFIVITALHLGSKTTAFRDPEMSVKTFHFEIHAIRSKKSW